MGKKEYDLYERWLESLKMLLNQYPNGPILSRASPEYAVLLAKCSLWVGWGPSSLGKISFFKKLPTSSKTYMSSLTYCNSEEPSRNKSMLGRRNKIHCTQLPPRSLSLSPQHLIWYISISHLPTPYMLYWMFCIPPLLAQGSCGINGPTFALVHQMICPPKTWIGLGCKFPT